MSNHVENPSYDNDGQTGLLRAWTELAVSLPASSVAWNALDRNGSPGSGSALITNGVNGSPYVLKGLAQCFPRAAAGTITISADVFMPAGQPSEGSGLIARAGLSVVHFTDQACHDEIFNPDPPSTLWVIHPGNTGTWKATTLTPPALGSNVGSFLVLAVVNRAAAGSFPPNQAHFDNVSLTTPAGQWRASKGDLNRDGETDLILHNNVTGANAAWFLKDENRDGAAQTITPAAASLDWRIAGVDDFNADGRNDLLMVNGATGAAEFWLMNGTARVGAPVPLAGALPLPWKPSATADFNHDGKPDVVWRNYTTQKLSVWTMNGTAQLGTITPVPDQAVDGNWEIVSAQDLNADGDTDFLWYNGASGKIVYWWMDANVNRIVGNFTNPSNAGANNWKVLAGGDYGIGPMLGLLPPVPNSQDIVWRNATSGRIVLWFMNNAGDRTAGLFVTPDPPAPSTDWTVAGPR